MLADISGTKRGHIRKLKSRNLKITVRTIKTGTCIGAIITSRRVTGPRNIILKDEKGDLFADLHSFMTRWRNYFSKLLNVRVDKVVWQEEIHTAEPLVSPPSAVEVELAIEKVKSHKSPGIDQIPTELIKAGGRTICFAIHKKGNKKDCNNYRGIKFLPTTYNIFSNILFSSLIPYEEEVIEDHQIGFRSNRSITDHIFCIRQIIEKKW